MLPGRDLCKESVFGIGHGPDFFHPVQEFLPCGKQEIAIGKQYTIVFDYLPRYTVETWSNLFRFTETDQNCCGPNDRNPALFVFNNTFRLHFTVATEENYNSSLRPEFDFEPDQVYNIRIKVDTTWVAIYVDG